MFLLLIGGCFALLAGFGFFLSWYVKKFAKNDDASMGWAIFGLVMVFIVLFFIVLVLPIKVFWSVSDQREDQTVLQQTVDVEKVLQDCAEQLTVEFRTILDKDYPEHEREIFRKIVPDSVNFYAAMFPQIQASLTAMKLVDEIRDLYIKKYEQQVLRAGILQRMRYRQQNPWIICSFVPRVDESKIPSTGN